MNWKWKMYQLQETGKEEGEEEEEEEGKIQNLPYKGCLSTWSTHQDREIDPH